MNHFNNFIKNYPFSSEHPSRAIKLNAVYALTHLSSKKIYVGSSGNIGYRLHAHNRHLKKGTHPNRCLQRAYNENDEMKTLVIITSTRNEAYDLEQQMIDQYKPLGLLFNRATDARRSGKNFRHSPETIEKLRQNSTGRKLSEEAKKLIGLASKGRSLGLKRSIETKAKMSTAQKGRKATPETLKKMSLARTGMKHVQRWSEEAKERASKRVEVLKKSIRVDGVPYDSITAAAKHFGKSRRVVADRVNSTTARFKNWEYR